MSFAYCGGALFIAGLVAREALHMHDSVLVVSLVGFGIAALAMMAAWSTALLCPSCGGNLCGLLIGNPGYWPRVDQRIQCCPYCRLEMDAELPAPAR